MLLLLSLLVCFTGTVFTEQIRFDGYRVVEITPETQKQVTILKELLVHINSSEVDVWQEVSVKGRPVHVSLTPTAYHKYIGLFGNIGLKPVTVIDNVQDLIKMQLPPVITERAKTEGFDYGQYHTLEEINDWIDMITNKHAFISKKFQIARSYEGRDIYAIQIDTNRGYIKKPGFFMQGGIHAREWISPATVIYMTGQMLDKYGIDNTITEVVDKYTWYMLPVFNVDGYRYTWTTDRLWRKTRSEHFICTGTDPNRNWGTSWCTEGASNDSCSNLYCGPTPFSEIEVRDIAQFIYNNADKIDVYIDFHAYSQLWMTPYSSTRWLPEDYEDIDTAASVAVEALESVHGTLYTHGSVANTIYIASGSTLDWTYTEANIKYSYGVELRDTGAHGFLLPSRQIIPTGEETLAAVTALANYLVDKV